MRKSDAIVSFLVVIYIIFLIAFGELPGLESLIYLNGVSDKIAHVIFAFALTYFMNLILFPRKIQLLGMQIMLGTVVMSTLFFIDEFIQMFIPSRDANLLDLAASLCGLFVADCLGHLRERRQN